MDPNATLAMLRDAMADEDAASVMDLFGALDEWLSKGGFPPDAWQR